MSISTSALSTEELARQLEAGRVLLGQGEAQRAAEHFEDLVRRASHYAPAYSFLGATFARLGRADDSVAAFAGGGAASARQPNSLL